MRGDGDMMAVSNRAGTHIGRVVGYARAKALLLGIAQQRVEARREELEVRRREAVAVRQIYDEQSQGRLIMTFATV